MTNIPRLPVAPPPLSLSPAPPSRSLPPAPFIRDTAARTGEGPAVRSVVGHDARLIPPRGNQRPCRTEDSKDASGLARTVPHGCGLRARRVPLLAEPGLCTGPGLRGSRRASLGSMCTPRWAVAHTSLTTCSVPPPLLLPRFASTYSARSQPPRFGRARPPLNK